MKERPKRIVALKHGGGELANQLWNYISLYAYSLESGRPISNPSFYEYHRAFNLESHESIFTRTLSFLFYGYRGRKSRPWKGFWRKIYALYPYVIKKVHPERIISSENTENRIHYLPPTQTSDELAKKQHEEVLYFCGWLFRNPLGLTKYREELVERFSPKERITRKAEALINPLRNKARRVIGVHIRQGDYKNFKSGRFWIAQQRMREVVIEFMKERGYAQEETALLIVSDGAIEPKIWESFTFVISKENAFTDLFALSMTAAIVGSNSSFGHFASWYGNIPHIVATNEPIDWEYYRDKDGYFPNKHASLVQF
jgi:hypothetical protein